MVTKTTYTNVRQSLLDYMNQAISTREPVYITRRGAEDVALISADELSGIMETAHLLRSPANARRLLEALVIADEDNTPPSSIDELRRELGIE